MMLLNLLTLLAAFVAAAIGYRFRARIFAVFRRFEARNAARRMEEFRALTDRDHHYRQTIAIAEEQVEPVSKITARDERTGQPVPRYVFLGETYADLKEAEAARYREVISKAREFYIDLDRVFLSRRRRREPTVEAPPRSETDGNR
ncbi:MAG TPA: hypothetical protein VEU06_00845 [Micropepsaceae bacterium]|nr:hypothetical protein [Micropepsaceae bacterium]